MKIRAVRVNNRRKVLELRTSRAQFLYPFAKLDPRPSTNDPLVEVRVDKELASEAVTYRLASGREGAVHIEQVLEYNRDPDYLRDQLLYRLTLEAQKRLATSSLPRREIIRRLGTSATQFYRLLDQTNYTKSVDQLISLLQALDCEVDLRVRAKRAQSVEVLAEPGEDLLPAVYGRGLAILRAVDGEEGVARVLVGVELVDLPVLLQRGLGLGHVVRRGARVLDAEEPEQRARQILGEVDGGRGLARRQLLRLGHHASAIAIDRGIHAAQRARGKIGLASPGAVADDADLAVQIGQAAEEVDGPLHVAHGAIVGHATGGADARAVLLGCGLALAEVQVGHDGDVSVMGEAARDRLVRDIPARHVMDDDHARVQERAQGPGQVGIDLISLMPSDQDGLGELSFVCHIRHSCKRRGRPGPSRASWPCRPGQG